MEKRMNKNPKLGMRDAFRIMKPGRFYWRLWTVLLAGAFFSSSAYQISLWVEGLSFEPLFYMVLLGAVSFIGGDLRDGMVAKGSLERYLLWPVNRKRKMLWLYLRSTWIPGILFLLGGLIFGDFAEGVVFSELLYSLPYGLSALFILAFITWRGSFVSMDVEGMVAVSFRMESGVVGINLLLIISPLGLMLVPAYGLYPVALAMIVFGIRLFHSEESLLQLGGVSQNSEERYPKWLSGNFGDGDKKKIGKLEKMKSPLLRYYKFLEWEEHRNPLPYYLIALGTVLFIVTIYYGLMGFLLAEQSLSERGMVLGMLIGYGTFFLQHVSMSVVANERALLLPMKTKEKAQGEFLHRFLRPTVYLLLNSGIVSGIIGGIHVFLYHFFSGQEVSWLPLVTESVYYALRLLPLWIAVFSLGEGIVKGATLFVQRIGFYQIRSFVFAVYFFLYLIPLGLSIFFYKNFISEMSTYTGSAAILLFLVIGIISRWGIYQMSKRIQVIGI